MSIHHRDHGGTYEAGPPTRPKPAIEVKARIRCETCQGTGRVETYHWCEWHGATDTKALAALRPGEHNLPCGCLWRDLRESDRCTDCEGEGWFVRWVELSALLAGEVTP